MYNNVGQATEDKSPPTKDVSTKTKEPASRRKGTGYERRQRLKSLAHTLQSNGLNRKDSRAMAWSKAMRQELKAYEGDLATYAKAQKD